MLVTSEGRSGVRLNSSHFAFRSWRRKNIPLGSTWSNVGDRYCLPHLPCPPSFRHSSACFAPLSAQPFHPATFYISPPLPLISAGSLRPASVASGGAAAAPLKAGAGVWRGPAVVAAPARGGVSVPLLLTAQLLCGPLLLWLAARAAPRRRGSGSVGDCIPWGHPPPFRQ